MREIHWTLSCLDKNDHEKIKILSERGKLLRMTTVGGRPVCWEYELEGARDRRTDEPVLITAFVSAT